MLWEILLILVLILANGLFAAAEIAIIAARRGRLEQRAAEGSRGAQWAIELSRNPDVFLPTVQIGITLVGAFGAAYGGRQIVDDLSGWFAQMPWPWVRRHADGIGLTVFVACFTYASLILGELVPKRISLHRAEGLAIFVAPIMKFIAAVGPAARLVHGRFHQRRVVAAAAWHNAGALRVARRHRAFDRYGHGGRRCRAAWNNELALGALRLGERTVRDIMRPRIDLDAMDVDTPPEEVLGTVAMAGFSRLPVYEGDLDHVIGFVHIKDLFRQQYLGWPIELRKLLHPALFVPETMTLDRLLELFQEKHNQLAIVLNEYGGTEGMVTLEDVVEEIVGEIRDEHRRHEEQKFVAARRAYPGSSTAAVSIADLVDRLELPRDDSVGRPRIQHGCRPDSGPARPHSLDRRHGRLERPRAGSRRHGRPADRPRADHAKRAEA